MTPSQLVIPTQLPGLELRQLILPDAEVLFALIDKNREHLTQWGENTAEKYPTVEAMRRSIEKPKNPRKLRFGIWENEALVGSINFTPGSLFSRCFIGYWMAKDYCGLGLTSEATRSLTTWVLTHRCKNVFAFVHLQNLASHKVLWKVGFVFDSIHNGYVYYRKTAPPPRV